MKQIDTQSSLFDGWDNTPQYDGSQTNALKCFSDIFHTQINTQRKQTKNANQINTNNIKNTPTNKQSIVINNSGQEDINHQKRKETSAIKKSDNEIKKFQEFSKAVSQLNRENITNHSHINSIGIQDDCIFETITSQKQLSNSQSPNNFKTLKNQQQELDDINSNQIFMKKNLFQDRSQRNAQFDQTSTFQNSNSQRNSKIINIQQYQPQNAQSSEGKFIVKQKLSDKQLRNKYIESLNQDLYQLNTDDKNLNYQLKNAYIDSVENFKISDNLQSQNYIGINAISITQQSDQENTYNIIDIADTPSVINRFNQKKQFIQEEQESFNHQNNNFSLKDFCSQAQVNIINQSLSQENNQSFLQASNIIVVTPEKFIPFHKQEQNNNQCKTEQQLRNKSSNKVSRNERKINSNQIVKTEGDNRQKYHQRMNLRDTEDNQLNNEITSSFRQHQLSLQLYRNQIKNISNDQIFYDEAKKDINQESNDSQTIKYSDYSRLSTRPLTISKLQNYKISIQSSSPSHKTNALNNSQEKIDGNNQDKQIETLNDKSKEKETKFSTFIYGKINKIQSQNSSNEKVDQINRNKMQTKENKIQGEQTKQKDTSLMNQRLNNLVSKFNTDQSNQINEIKQTLNQNNELNPYTGIFNLTNAQFNIPKKNKSLDPETNKIIMGDNIFYYYQQDKLPLLKYKKKNQNEFLKLINKKIITQKQQNNNNISKDKLNTQNGGNRTTLYDTYQKQQTLIDSSPQITINNCITPKSKNQYNQSNEQRISTAGDFQRYKSLNNNTRQSDKKSTPIKGNIILNQTKQINKTNYSNNQQLNSISNLIFQPAKVLDTTNFSSNYINSTLRQNNNDQNGLQAITQNSENTQINQSLNNYYQCYNAQNEYNSNNETYSSSIRKNKLRIFQHNQMFKIVPQS